MAQDLVSHAMTPPLSIEVLDSLDRLGTIDQEWNALLAESVWPTPYMRLEYIRAGVAAFSSAEDQLLILALRDAADGLLVAIFPLRIRPLRKYALRLAVLEYAVTTEIDKPYPIIRRGREETVWRTFASYAATMPWPWDILELIEVRDQTEAPRYLAQFLEPPRYLLTTGDEKDSPVIALDRDWAELWDHHPHMRKKHRLMFRDLGESLRFEVHDAPSEWEQCLAAYLDLERRSWKQGTIGISKNQRITQFYRDLFAAFAPLGFLRFGFLYLNDRLISGEIAYVSGNQVYFCHGSYDETYRKYSPGLVSKSLFIQYFHGKGYECGDYLAGYADYMKNWSIGTVSSRTVRLFRKGFKVRAYLLLLALRRSVYQPLKASLRATIGSS